MARNRCFPLVLALLAPLVLPFACGTSRVASPFGPGAGGAGGEGGLQGDAGFMLGVDAGDDTDPTLGGPCQDDGQCDDEVTCTFDSCDRALRRCRFQPDDGRCGDSVYCNGAERCDVRNGCVPGEPVACGDDDTCTIDLCVEATQSCRHDPRDADGDGDPTRNCGGDDCDDGDALINNNASEVCGNRRDDDCDGATDEQGCVSPKYDECADALVVDEDGRYELDLTATSLDYPTRCTQDNEAFRDAVVKIIVPEGGPFDVDITAKRDGGNLALGTAITCGDAASASCEESVASESKTRVSRLIWREAAAGEHPLYVSSDTEGLVQLQVRYRPAEAQLGELCEEALPLVAGAAAQLLRLPGYRSDFDSKCEPFSGDAFATFTLDTASDITLIAEGQYDFGQPVIALLDAACAAERTCRSSQPGRLFERNLPAGTYGVLIAATGPEDVSLRLETAPVSEAPLGEGCDGALPLAPGGEQLVDLALHEDAVDPECLVGAPDATFSFSLAQARDVLLVGRFADGDRGAVSISDSNCGSSIACVQGKLVQRAARYGLGAGEYRAVIESTRGNPVSLSLFERPAVAAVNVPFSDDCSAPVTIPETGGRYSGNTSNAFPDFDAGCDVGGQEQGGAPDQILRLALSVPRRVIFDMQGSGYPTMLSVRRGKFCPGAEVLDACAPGYGVGRSFLDLDLPAGDYFVQIDGYDGASGPWKLDVFTAPL